MDTGAAPPGRPWAKAGTRVRPRTRRPPECALRGMDLPVPGMFPMFVWAAVVPAAVNRVAIPLCSDSRRMDGSRAWSHFRVGFAPLSHRDRIRESYLFGISDAIAGRPAHNRAGCPTVHRAGIQLRARTLPVRPEPSAPGSRSTSLHVLRRTAWIPHAGPGASSESMPAGRSIVKRGCISNDAPAHREASPQAHDSRPCCTVRPSPPPDRRSCAMPVAAHSLLLLLPLGRTPAASDALIAAVNGHSFLPLVILFCFGPYGGNANSSR
jgi:hypothetical protein